MRVQWLNDEGEQQMTIPAPASPPPSTGTVHEARFSVKLSHHVAVSRSSYIGSNTAKLHMPRANAKAASIPRRLDGLSTWPPCVLMSAKREVFIILYTLRRGPFPWLEKRRAKLIYGMEDK